MPHMNLRKKSDQVDAKSHRDDKDAKGWRHTKR